MLGKQVLTMRDSIMVARLDNTVARLGGYMYGRCLECDRDIADRCLRLRAPSAAMRCQACDQRLARRSDFRDSRRFLARAIPA
jgi:RNA polymerase-binding transcription factor DksA